MNNYYWECKHSRGWRKAETDHEARKYFSRFFSDADVWRVEQSGEKVLILSQKRKRERPRRR